jgi:hypothetical protein
MIVPRPPCRRGNALVLVSAMLVLLTLIAAAYLSRTRTQRITAAAIQETAGESRRAETIGKQLATEIAQHLFVRPIDPVGAANYVGGDSAGNRLPPPPEAVRYGIESAPPRQGSTSPADRQQNAVSPALAGNREPGSPQRIVGGADGFPDGYNFAPYAVIPWTNWPDFQFPTPTPAAGGTSNAGLWWVQGFGATQNAMTGNIYGNPPGNPGFGDTRWLRSSEPVRAVDLGQPGQRNLAATPGGAFFSHWPHLSWIAAPWNGYRLVTDLADIEGSLRQGGLGDNTDGFGSPYEQWLPDVTPNAIPVTAGEPTDEDDGWVTEFTRRRNLWFTRDGYRQTIGNVVTNRARAKADTLPNFIKMDDPLGIGRADDPDAEPVAPSDEYVEGTPRNIVARTFADADGDGWTDSFWFLAPVGKERNVRTVVGVSVIDNASMLDLNVATRFDRRTTVGFTPSDLAVVTAQPELAITSAPSLNFARTDTRAGLFDNERNFSFGTVDPRDPGAGGNPAAFRTPLTSRTGFGMAFDPYRFAGRPTPQDPRAAPVHDEGSPSMLQSLGVRMTDPRSTEPDPESRTFWSPYFHGAPGVSLNMGPWLGYQLGDEGGPQVDVFGPGGPVRQQQSDPLVLVNGSWEPYFRYLWGDTARDNINGPFMRPEERARWFNTAMAGEMRVFAPFAFGVGSTAQTVEAIEMYPQAVSGVSRDISGRRLPIRPFDSADEMELRAFFGSNDSTNMSRLEKALNSDDMVRDKDFEILDTILRSSVLRSETGAGGAQLTNAQLVKDMRRKVTAISGQRNELMPPWLWTGRPYLRFDQFDPLVTFQNAALWIGLHPETPGPRDENNDGRIDGDELKWGVYDLRRVSRGSDPYPDGNGIEMDPPEMDYRDWKRGTALFEYVNRKLDLRQPLLVQLFQGPVNALSEQRNAEGLPLFKHAYSAPEERRAQIEFAREVRQRLRPALRTHSPQRNPLDWTDSISGNDPEALPDVERLGPLSTVLADGSNPTVRYASYTDRFVDQLRMGLDARVAESADPAIATAANQPTVALAGDQFPWRSAWSTEAMTASLAANVATWRSRPTMIRETSRLFPNRDLGFRPTWQPILPNLIPAADPARNNPLLFAWWSLDYGDRTTGTGREREVAPAQTIRAVDPSKPGQSIPNWDYPNEAFEQPGEETADLVFPGNEKHPFLTECFFGWVYPATTTNASGRIEPGVVRVSECPDDPDFKDHQFVAIVNGRVGTNADVIKANAANPAGPDAVDEDRDELNEIRTPILVVQVANPWSEPIRLGDFRLSLFGQRYDFPDYEIDANGAVVLDADGRPVPLMLNPGTETAPATATVYLIANVLGNPTDDPAGTGVTAAAQGDLPKVAQWDPWFRRRWLDYLDLYEFQDGQSIGRDVDGTQAAGAWLDPQPKATSPNAWPLYSFNDGSGPLRQSKLLNAMASEGDPDKGRITDLRAFRDALTPDNLKRGIVLQRVLRDPSAVTAAQALLRKNLAQWDATDRRWELVNAQDTAGLALEVDRFDADPGFDHFSAKVTAIPAGGSAEMFKDPAANFDTNLVTGGRFWSACARITLPPAEDLSPFDGTTARDLATLVGSPLEAPGGSPLSFEEPRGVRGAFPPPTASVLVRPASDPFECARIDPNTGDLIGDSAQAPKGFPGIMLGDRSTTRGRDYFTTWTRVARHWSRLHEVRLGTLRGLTGSAAVQHPTPLPAGAAANLPVWTWTRQAVDGSFLPVGTGTGYTPRDRFAPRFVFANRTEPDQTINPLLPPRVELVDFRMNPALAPADPSQAAQEGTAVQEQALGDIFRLDAGPSPQDPDDWSPTLGSTAWMEDTDTFGWLTSPVWGPLPDLVGLGVSGAPAAVLAASSWPELILRKPTAFSCQTVIDPQSGRYDAVNRLGVAYYGDPTRPAGAAGNPVNTRFVMPGWAQPEPAWAVLSNGGIWPTIHPDFTRIYMGDKGARLVDHDGKRLPLVLATGRTDPTRHAWTMQGVWNTLARFPQVDRMQMLQKDDDFEHLGELLDVFCWGPAYRIGEAFNPSGVLIPAKLRASSVLDDNPAAPVVGVPKRLVPQCRATFAEIMTGRVPGFPVGEGDMVNRLQVDPPNLAFDGAQVWQFSGNPALSTPYAPAIPWAARVFDAFTVDGPGAAPRYDWSDSGAGLATQVFPTSSNGGPVFEQGANVLGATWDDMRQDVTTYRDTTMAIDTRVFRPVGSLIPVGAYIRPGSAVVTRTSLAQWEYDRSPSLSGGFRGKPVKGLININTAPIEVMRALPHMTQMIYDDSGRLKNGAGFTVGSPSPGPNMVAGDDRFEPDAAPSAGFVRNPASLLPDSIEIYRNRLNPSPALAGTAANAAAGWTPLPSDPLLPALNRQPTQPTYNDRGDPVPAFGSAASAAALGADWSFARPSNNNIGSAPSRVADVPVPFNRGMRAAAGFGSIGELVGMARTIVPNPDNLAAVPAFVNALDPGAGFPDWQYNQGWSVRMAGNDPYRASFQPGGNNAGLGQGWFADDQGGRPEPLDARLSTDRQGVRQFNFVPGGFVADAWTLTPDNSYGDSEEQNLLFKGISNLITTRSDVFTVYFRVRTVKQDPTTGKWNGVDPDSILEDARYVMCVDRTNVNRPSDEPRIVFFSRVQD